MALLLFLITPDRAMALRFHKKFVPGTEVRKSLRITAHNDRQEQKRQVRPGARPSIKDIDPGEESMAAAHKSAPDLHAAARRMASSTTRPEDRR